MRVLITGHLGYIGVEMTSYLADLGHDIVGLDTDLYAECDFLASPDPVPALDIDLRDVTVADLIGFDAVIHLAALSNDPLADLNPLLTYDINRDASIRLAEAAKDGGGTPLPIRVVVQPVRTRRRRRTPRRRGVQPRDAVWRIEGRVERALSALADDTFSPVYLRNATAYGVSRRLRADVVVNNLVGHAVTSGKVCMQSDGSPWRPLVHVLDIAHAFAQALAAPRDVVHNQAFNVGRVGENYRVRDVANLVAEVVPGVSVSCVPGATSDIRDYRVDFGKIEREMPGYRPQWTVRQGIEQLWAAYCAAE